MSLESLLRFLPARFSPEASMRGVFLTITVVLTGIAWLGIASVQQRLAKFRLDIVERVELLDQQDELREQAEKLDKLVADTKRDCEFVIAKLPSTPAESEFLTHLSERAATFDVTLGDYRPGSIHARPTASQLELRLRATGSYTGLCQWLDNMSQMPRLVQIQHLTLTGPATPGGDCTVDLHLMIMFGFAEEVH